MSPLAADPGPLRAYELVVGFAALRGEAALRLAMHAALPQVLRADLLHLIRLNFTPEAALDLAIEADVLLAPFCEDIGNGYYCIARNARLQLLRGLDPAYRDEPLPRSVQVALFMLDYLDHQQRAVHMGSDWLRSDWIEAERWSALAFADPELAAGQLAAVLARATANDDLAARVRVGGLASTLATPLARFGELLAYAEGVEALQMGRSHNASRLLTALPDREIRIAGIRLKSPRRVLSETIRRQAPSAPAGQATGQMHTSVEAPQAQTEAGPSPTGEAGEARDRVFVSYSHFDVHWHNLLSSHLRPALGALGLTLWAAPGDLQRGGPDPRTGEMRRRTRLVIILVSAAYLASRHARERELPSLIELARSGDVTLTWVRLDHCVWRSTPLHEFQAAHDPNEPLVSLSALSRDKAYKEIVTNVTDLVGPDLRGIFICYRRGEAIREARAVYERLHREFGAQAVFIDLHGFDFGEDYVDSLERQLAQCQVMLALIGPQWAMATDGRGRRRLTLENDFVRIELRTALGRRGVRVVPVLIDGAELPDADELPEDLRPLLRRHALPLRFASFDADMGRLCASLRRIVSAPGVGAAPAASAGSGPREKGATRPARQAPAAPVWSSAAGADEFGRWAEFSVGAVVQRLRWIEPGEFQMGSPDDEPERDTDESPQHRVRITHGFWLADTACTQGLWLAVMGGKNPAHFTGDMKLPVEQVSHDDVQAFLSALQAKLKDASVLLPTEAQWEYACRAGTTGPFSFGAQITPEQVNYDGNYPYNGGAKGIYRERTVPVKSLPANRWGLHEMHGNVWEWCADGLRKYPTTVPREPLADPLGPQEQGPEALRAVRGGSWIRDAWIARSAFRLAYRRIDRYVYLGFRLALRSDE